MAFVFEVFSVDLKKRVSVPFAIVDGKDLSLIECLSTAVKSFESTYSHTRIGRIVVLFGDELCEIEG